MKLDQLSMEYMSTARVSEASPGPGAAAPLLRLLRAGAGQPRAERSCGAHVKHLEELIRSSQRRLALVGWTGWMFFPIWTWLTTEISPIGSGMILQIG